MQYRDPSCSDTACGRLLATWLVLCIFLAGAGPVRAGAACVMAKFNGKTIDYELLTGSGHPVELQEEAERRLRARGYDDFHKNLDVVRPQNLTRMEHGLAVVIRSEFKDSRGRERSVMGCGFARTPEEALWDALRDGQSYFWGWKPDRDGYELVHSRRF